MAHHVYKTEAFVLKALPRGDSNHSLELYTKELGFIRATAQGVRKIKSKLKYSLQEYSYTEITLVFGKGGWRITGASEKDNYFYGFENKEARNLVARIFSVIKMYAASEESNYELYEVIKSSIEAMKDSDDHESIEILAIVRMLNILGYVDGSYVPEFVTNVWNRQIYENTKLNSKKLIGCINKGFEASQL